MKNIDKLFNELLVAEQEVYEAENQLKRAKHPLEIKLLAAENKLKTAKRYLDEEMQKQKLVTAKVIGANADYIINYSPPRKSVEVVDIEALPDEFVRVKKEPDKIKLKEHLEKCAAETGFLPNYAKFSFGEPILQWRLKKKTHEEV